jgi:2'-5' RNA ligase
MKATFALLANNEIHNLVRKLSWDIHRKYQTGIDVTCLPPHISLKQPFDIADLDALEKYMIELAETITPFDMQLTELQLVNMTMDGLDTGLLWLNVQETKLLRQLHNRVNRELTARFENTQAAFDGPKYHFHMTVAMGNQPVETYQQALNEFSGRLINLQCTIREIVMFVYDETASLRGGYMTYMILPLGSLSSKSST